MLKVFLFLIISFLLAYVNYVIMDLLYTNTLSWHFQGAYDLFWLYSPITFFSPPSHPIHMPN